MPNITVDPHFNVITVDPHYNAITVHPHFNAITVDPHYNVPFDISDINGRENSSVVAFFGRLSPLSNFHNTALNIEGTSYCCVEQYYQREKALAAQDEKTAIQIMITKDPIQMKILGESVKIQPADNWEPNVTMKIALEAKFGQDPNLRNFLLQTGDRKIVEASMNYKWGCGQM